MIRLAGVPCFNSPLAIENGHHRLGMLATLREIGATTIPFDVASGDHVAERLSPQFPAVVKVGTHHGGLGKYRVQQATEWRELTDLLYAADDFVSVEPWTAHRRDVRCLMVGENVWAMERVGSSWRANVDTKAFHMIAPPPLLEQWTRDLAVRLGAPIMSIDALETMDGQWVVLESNETPGISGFPSSVRDSIVRLVDAANPGQS